MKVIIATFSIIYIVLIFSSFVQPLMAFNNVEDATFMSKPNGFCGSKCAVRCSKAGHENCMKYCQICCQKCNCVPSGTYGNKHECPCYRDLRNSKGKPKCP